MRWYRFPKEDKNALPGLFSNLDLSTVGTQCETLLAQSSRRGPNESKALIVRLLYNIFKTISYYCKVCTNCILRDKSANAIISEYCKRVFL